MGLANPFFFWSDGTSQSLEFSYYCFLPEPEGAGVFLHLIFVSPVFKSQTREQRSADVIFPPRRKLEWLGIPLPKNRHFQVTFDSISLTHFHEIKFVFTTMMRMKFLLHYQVVILRMKCLRTREWWEAELGCVPFHHLQSLWYKWTFRGSCNCNHSPFRCLSPPPNSLDFGFLNSHVFLFILLRAFGC